MTLEKFKKAYPWILTALTVICGVCYIIAVCHLYFTGGRDPYSRERVGYYLCWLIAPSTLLVAGSVYGFILWRAEGKKYVQKPIDKAMPLVIMQKKRPISVIDKESGEKALAQRKLRMVLRLAAGAVSLICLIPALIVALNKELYTIAALNDSIISVCIVVLPLSAVALAAWIVCAVFCKRSEEQELEILRSASVVSEVSCDASGILTKIDEKQEIITLAVRGVVLAAAITFIIIGITNGGMTDVLAKAVKICTECIGLG